MVSDFYRGRFSCSTKASSFSLVWSRWAQTEQIRLFLITPTRNLQVCGPRFPEEGRIPLKKNNWASNYRLRYLICNRCMSYIWSQNIYIFQAKSRYNKNGCTKSKLFQSIFELPILFSLWKTCCVWIYQNAKWTRLLLELLLSSI